MSDSLLSFTILFAEIGGVLLLLAIGLVIRNILGSRKETKITKNLVKFIKTMIPAHRDQLGNYFKDRLEQNKTDFNIDTLIKDEKKIYERLIKVSISKDTSLLKLTTEDINSLINDYVRLLSLKAEKVIEADPDKESHELKLRKENDALRLKNASLETRVETLNETIENMMSEFSSMYEGGKKEGEQRLKNEMYQLKQSLEGEEAKVQSELADLDKEKDD